MSQTCPFVALEDRALSWLQSVIRVGARACSALAITFLALAGFSANASGVDAGFFSALEWRFVGPYRGGRVVAVAGHADDPLVYYFGAAHGGVWKTNDAGLNWRNVSDGFFKFPAVGGLDVSLSDPGVIYVGTGEGLPRQFISPGDGVYKSIDGGETWSNIGLQETRHIARVRIHPTNPDIVYVAAMGDMFGPNPERGVYRSKNGGETWERVLYRGETAGAVDLVIDAKNPEVIMAAMNHHRAYPWDEESGGPGTGLFRSTDGGDSWVDITRNPGLPKSLVGKIGIAISPARSSRLFAFMEADAGEGGIYRSDDSGSTWQMTHTDPWKLETPNSYSHITADPLDPDVVYIQIYEGLLKSTDAGQTFERVPMQNWDSHALWIDPVDPRRMIEGGDGGASVSLNGGKSWSSLDNQPTADLLSLAVDDQDPYWLYAAQNDNSHMAIPSQTDDQAITRAHYVPLPVGEGGHTAVKPDGSVIYANDRAKSVRIERETGLSREISVWPEWIFGTPVKDIRYRFYYSFPIIVSPHDSGVLYTAAQFLFRSVDEGHTWDTISLDLTQNRQEVMSEVTGGPISSLGSSLFHTSVIRTIAESPISEGELWVGTDDSTVQFTKDGGRNWSDVSPKDLPEWTTITAIDVSHHHPGTVYISGEGHRVSDRTPHLYKTTDYGRRWQKITNGIRENDYTWVVREDPIRPGLLYAGAETGAYVSFDDGDSWQSLQNNLPPVIVMHMQVKDDDLVVATHGRGFWILDNISSLRTLTPEVASSQVHLFEVAPAIRNVRGGRGWTKLRDGAENPPRGVMFEYYLAEPAVNPVTIKVAETNGEVIKEFTSDPEDIQSPSTKGGMNRFFWDMRYPGTEMPMLSGVLDAFSSADWTGGSYEPPTSPIARPGQYSVRLTVDGESREQPFEIRMDPRIKASDEDLEAQFDLMVDIRDWSQEVADTVLQIRDVRSEIEGRRSKLTEKFGAKADAVLEELRQIEGILMVWAGTEAHPMMFGAPGLTEKLNSLSNVISSSDARPTASMYAVFEELQSSLEIQRNRLNDLIEQRVTPLLSGR